MHIHNSQRGQLGFHLPEKLLVDNFAGGGGASLGMEMAFGRPVDIAINHNEKALGMHHINHPDTDHYIESVWNVSPLKVTRGRPVECAWFSPDCTHHSKARGGKPKKKEIRGLAWVSIRWMMDVRPEIVPLENVEEFRSWGPLDANGQAIKEHMGKTFDAFVLAMTSGLKPLHNIAKMPGLMTNHSTWQEAVSALGIQYDMKKKLQLKRGLGYVVDFKELKACDFGAPTIRKRLFMVARCDGYPIVWPEPTHGPADSVEVKIGKLLPYRTAAECIDWSIPVKSIFGRKEDIAESSENRIARGLWKYVLNNDDPFFIPAENVAPFITEHANASNQRNMPANEPLRTITAQTKGGTFAVVAPELTPLKSLIAPIVDRQFGTATGNAIDAPLGTIMANGGGGKNSLIAAFIVKHYGGNYRGSGLPVTSPLHTVTTTDHHNLVYGFVTKYYSEGGQWSGMKDPLHTIPTKDRMGLILVRGEEYVLTDIGQRMFQPAELYKAQGFLDGYIHDRYIDRNGVTRPLTKADQVRMCGNSVSPPAAAALLRANIEVRNKVQRRAAA